MEELTDFPHTIVIYESVHRIIKTLTDIEEIFGERHLCVARELSKIHEEYIRGTAGEVREKLTKEKQKGEFVIVIGGRDND